MPCEPPQAIEPFGIYCPQLQQVIVFLFLRRGLLNQTSVAKYFYGLCVHVVFDGDLSGHTAISMRTAYVGFGPVCAYGHPFWGACALLCAQLRIEYFKGLYVPQDAYDWTGILIWNEINRIAIRITRLVLWVLPVTAACVCGNCKCTGE